MARAAGKYELHYDSRHSLHTPMASIDITAKKRPSLKLGGKGFFAQRDLPHQDKKDSSNFPVASTGPATDSRTQPCAGLTNLGNTCYANSVLQVLRHCPGFSEGLVDLAAWVKSAGGVAVQATPTPGPSTGTGMPRPLQMETQPTNHPVSLVDTLHQLVQEMVTMEGRGRLPLSVKPTQFITKLKEEHVCFAGSSQQDAQEMLRFLLTYLQDSHMHALACATATTSGHTQQKPSRVQSPSLCSSSESSLPMTVSGDQHCNQQDSSSESSVSAAVLPLCRPHTLGNKRRRQSSSEGTELRRGTKAFKHSRGSVGKLSMCTGRSNTLTKFFSPVSSTTKMEKCEMPLTCTMTSKSTCTTSSKPQTSRCATPKDLVSSIFQGSLAYQTRCFECCSCTERSETFLDISVPVLNPSLSGVLGGQDPRGLGVVSQTGPPHSQAGPCSLSWALAQFASREQLRGDNKYWCDECGHFTEAERSILFSKLPRVMTVHLNQFATQAWGTHATVTVRKVAGNIAVPQVLCLKPWSTTGCPLGDRAYHLFAVIFHSGGTCTSGHYTTCVRARECFTGTRLGGADEWLLFDDEAVQWMSQEQLLRFMSPLATGSSTPYILFYTS